MHRPAPDLEIDFAMAISHSAAPDSDRSFPNNVATLQYCRIMSACHYGIKACVARKLYNQVGS